MKTSSISSVNQFSSLSSSNQPCSTWEIILVGFFFLLWIYSYNLFIDLLAGYFTINFLYQVILKKKNVAKVNNKLALHLKREQNTL